jgi:adenine-specific DNA-methyltransferase
MKLSSAVENINVMRYMGNKRKLMTNITDMLKELSDPGDLIVDLMAGTHSVGFEMSSRNAIVANDIGAYAEPIGKALLQRPEDFDPDTYIGTVAQVAAENRSAGIYQFFQTHYADTYFSHKQCVEIDDLRYAVEILYGHKAYAANLAMAALISAMCYAQSTPGHFAQFMPADHQRIKPLRAISILEAFSERYRYWPIKPATFANEVLSEDWRVVFAAGFAADAKVIYIDPPYNTEQYSRFYHVLETIVKYDNPTLSHKALYREDRFKSNFSYKRTVEGEFQELFEKAASSSSADILLSYSSTGIVQKDDFAKLCQPWYSLENVEEIDHPHSTQGKGMKKDVQELLLTFSKNK